MIESTILVIGDEPSLIENVGEVVRTIDDTRLAVLPVIDRAFSYEAWDGVSLILIHIDRRGPAPEVARLLRLISAARRRVPTLVLCDQFDEDQANTLLRLGAADYLTWPLDLAWLAYLIEVLTVKTRLAGMAPVADVPRGPEPDLDDSIFGPNPRESDPLMNQVRRVAPRDATILLSGETGTGKSRLAQTIHEMSPRRNQPFVVINCGAISHSSIEAEMFGHLRGAFAGADYERPGKFSEVGRGTLFLDEVDALPLHFQPKLLKVVEDRVFEAIGSNRPVPFRARLITASNRSLDQEVAASRFRSDLYYRLNVIGFQLPPLRERRGSISSLASRFLPEFASRLGSGVASISDEAMQALERHDWPGNIRELRNVIERSVALASGTEIGVDDLPESVIRSGQAPIENGFPGQSILGSPSMSHTTLAEIKRDAELARITEALEKHSNNRLRAASELGISRMTLYKKLYKYGLMQPNPATRGGVA